MGVGMDLQFTKEQQDIKKAAREFAEKEFPEVGKACDQSEVFPFDTWRKACDLGLIGCFVPEEYGGAGYGVSEQACIAEKFFQGYFGATLKDQAAAMSGEILLRYRLSQNSHPGSAKDLTC